MENWEIKFLAKVRENFFNTILKDKKAIVIDKNFPNLLNKEFYIDSGFIRTSILGTESIWYRLKENKHDILCKSFGPKQIKIL